MRIHKFKSSYLNEKDERECEDVYVNIDHISTFEPFDDKNGNLTEIVMLNGLHHRVVDSSTNVLEICTRGY